MVVSIFAFVLLTPVSSIHVLHPGATIHPDWNNRTVFGGTTVNQTVCSNSPGPTVVTHTTQYVNATVTIGNTIYYNSTLYYNNTTVVQVPAICVSTFEIYNIVNKTREVGNTTSVNKVYAVGTFTGYFSGSITAPSWDKWWVVSYSVSSPFSGPVLNPPVPTPGKNATYLNASQSLVFTLQVGLPPTPGNYNLQLAFVISTT